MASICNINDSKQQKLAEYLVTILRTNTKLGPEELKQLVTRMYNEVTEKTQNPSQGLVYASLVPFWTFKILAFNDSLRDSLDADTGAIDKVRKAIDTDKEFTYLIKYMGLSKEVQNTIKDNALQESLERSFRANAVVEERLTNIVQRRLRGKASLWTTELTEMNAEGEVIPEEAFHYDVMRSMLDRLAASQRTVNGEIQAEISSVGPVFFKLVSLKEFAKTNKVKNDKLISDNDFIYAMVDAEGKYVSLDQDMMPVSAEEGITPYFSVMSLDMIKINEFYVKDNLANVMFSPLVKIEYSDLSQDQKKQVDEKYEVEKRILLKAIDYAKTNPGQGYVFSVKGGRYTNIISDYIGDIEFTEDNPFEPRVDNSLTSTIPQYFIYNGKRYMISPQNQKRDVPNSGIAAEDVNTIVSLIFDKIYKSDGTELSVVERRKELYKFIYVMGEDINKKGNVLIDNGKDLYVEYTRSGILIKTKYNPNKEFQGEKGQLDLGAKTLTSISDLDIDKQKKLIYTLFKNLGFYRVSKEGIDNPDQYEWPVLTTNEDGNIVLSYNNDIDYIQWLKTSRGFKIVNPDESKNPYIILQPNQETVDNILSSDPKVVRFYEEVAKVEEKEKTEEEKPKRKKREKKAAPPPADAIYDAELSALGAASSRENPATQDKPSALDAVNKALENKKKGFKFKLIDVKGKEVKATPEQIEEAKTWYETLEVEVDGKMTKLTDLVPYKVMFDSVNSDYNNSVAFWNINKGIVLLEGADYSDLYHEAWHAFTQTFLTKEQRVRLYKEVSRYEGEFTDYTNKKVKFSEATEDQLEEYLAENFREYVLSKGTKAKNPTPVKMNIFQKIWKFIKSFFSNRTVQDVAENPTSGRYVDELYEKLRVGNLSEFSFDVKNRTYDQLAKGTIKPIARRDAASYSFTYTESKLILDTVDSIISDLATKLNLENGNTRATVGLFKGTNKLIAYQIVKETFTDGIIPSLRAELNQINYSISQETNPEKLQKLQSAAMRKEKYLTLAQKAVNEFGNTDDLEANKNMQAGVIYQHITTSEFVTDEERDEFLKDLDEGKTGKEPEMYSKSPQKNSLVDLASEDVLNLVRGLYQYDRKGNIEMNEFGVPKLADFVKTWNYLAKNLEGLLDTDKMYQKMIDLAYGTEKRKPEDIDLLFADPSFSKAKNKLMAQLLSKLGSYEAKGNEGAKVDGLMFSLQTNFWQAFNKTRVPLVQLTFTEDVEYETQADNQGNITTNAVNTSYVTTVGYATGEVNKVKTNWNKAFFSSNTKYIKDVPYEVVRKNKTNVSPKQLDINQVLIDFPRVPATAREKLKFLSAIGISITMGTDVLKQLENSQDLVNAVAFTHQRLQELSENGLTVNFIGDMFSERVDTDMVDQTHLLNYLANLEARYGDTVTSFMSTTADGETQFEHSLNSSFTRLVYELNNANNKAVLDALPHMNHLSSLRNPFTKGNRSIWMYSLFNPKNGDKRKTFKGRTNKVMFENLSGVKAIDEYGVENGVKTSEADPLAKLLLDFHSSSLRGTPELMTLSDKTSTYNASIDIVKNPFDPAKKQEHRYIDDGDFLLSEGRSSVEENSKDTKGNRLFFMILSNYLYSEIERMNTFRNILTNKEEMKLNYDYAYVRRGSDFVIFDDILNKETKKKLRAKLNLFNQNNIENKGISAHEFIELNFPEVENEIYEYLNKQYGAVKEMMDEAGYIDDRVVLNVKRNVKEKGLERSDLSSLDIDDYKNAAIRSFVANSWIHNMESIIMVFGDVAMYAIEKDEFHKRNAGFTSTGDLFRTDRVALDFVNEQVGNPYAESKKMVSDIINMDGSINTAVMEDTEHTAVFYPEYLNIFTNYYLDRMPEGSKNAEKAKEVAEEALKNYINYKQGDGQGWVTFDMYRKLLILEGKWDWGTQEKLYTDIVSGKDVSKDKIIKFFPVKKLQYMGPVVTDSLPVMAMHKFSLVPLIPNIIKDTNLEKLHHRMIRQGIGYATYKTGSKVGTITNNSEKSDAFYSDPKTLQFDESGKFVKNRIYLHYLKDQIETGEEFKNKVTFATQMRKLIIEGMVENGVPIDFMKGSQPEARIEAWEKLTEKERAKYPKYLRFRKYEKLIFDLTENKYLELLDRIGWSLDSKGKPKGDINTLIQYITTNLDKQDIAPHELSFIRVEKGKLKFDLSASFNAEQIEKLLNSIVVRELIRQKVNGEPLIQVSKSGWEKPTSKDIARFGDDLPFYKPVFDSEGKHISTTAMKIKVALKGDFKKLLNLQSVKELAESQEIKEEALQLNYNPRLVALNKLIKEESWLQQGDNRSMVSIVATRIPVQGLNSMEFMEVFEFLPENAGNIIIMPREIVAKSGSDFDIDKMFTMMPSMYSAFGEVKYVKHVGKLSRAEKSRLMNDVKTLGEEIKTIYDKYDDILERKDKQAEFKFTDVEINGLKQLKKEYFKNLREIEKRLVEVEAKEEAYLSGKLKDYEAEDLYLEIWGVRMEAFELDEKYREDQYKLIGSFENAVVKDLLKRRDKELMPLSKQFVEKQSRLLGATSKGIENELLNVMREVLEDPDNFVTMMRPNSTDIFDELSQEMAPFASDYDPKAVLNDEPVRLDKKGKPAISGTRVLEIPFNIYKRDTTNIGKQVLGIGAVENTYNILYNRIGMYLNHTSKFTYEEYLEKRKKWDEIDGLLAAAYKKKNMKEIAALTKEKDILKAEVKNFDFQEILMPHNKMVKDGKTVISLSGIYTADGKHKIADIISQMINGWVDVAKDQWIFNVQGNKEIAPSLLLLVEAGVPIDHAVYFVSQPLIREYITRQRRKKSAFAPAMGTAPENANMYRYESRKEILDEYDIVKSRTNRKETFFWLDSRDRFDATQRMNAMMGSKIADPQVLKDRLQEFRDQDEKQYNDLDKAVLLHFMQIEDMAAASQKFKLTTNVDTSKARSLFEASSKELAVADLKSEGRIPQQMIDRVTGENGAMEEGYGTAISSFFKALKYQQSIWGPLFKIRNSNEVKNFLLEQLSGPLKMEILDKTFGNDYAGMQKLSTTFLNDLMTYLFQNKLYDFDIQGIESFKGYEASFKAPKAKVVPIVYSDHSVYFLGGKVYINKNKLREDWLNLDKKDEEYPKEYQVASVTKSLFPNEQHYYRFVLEREYIRSRKDFSKISQTSYYKDRYESNSKRNSDLSNDEIRRMSYEETIRDMALMNSFNMKFMFGGNGRSMADTLELIKAKHKENLVPQFSLLENLSIYKYGGVANIKLMDNPKDPDMRALYNEQMMALMDPNQLDIEAPAEEKEFIANFFQKLPFFSILQAGYDTNLAVSIQRIMPWDNYMMFMNGVYKEFSEKGKTFSREFLETYFNEFMRQNSISNKQRNRMKAYNRVDGVELGKMLNPEDYESANDSIYTDVMVVDTDMSGMAQYDLKPYDKDIHKTIDDYIDEIARIIMNDNKVYIFNDVVDSSVGNPLRSATKADWIFKAVLSKYPTLNDNIIGIPTRTKYVNQASQAKIEESLTSPNEEFVEAFQKAIDQITYSDKQLVFNKKGYGQILIGADDVTAELPDKMPSASSLSPVTFDYISMQLLDNFGYLNPNFQDEEGIKAYQGRIFTIQDILEQINLC